jgi:hypothetical protein
MTARTPDAQLDRSECSGTHAVTTLPYAPSFQKSPSRGRPTCEWKQTADGRLTSVWTLSEELPAGLPELSSKDGLPRASPAENCIQARIDRTAGIDGVYLAIWIRHCPRPARIILGLAAAVGLFGLAAADMSRSTTVHSRETFQVSSTMALASPAIATPTTSDIVQSPVIDILRWGW